MIVSVKKIELIGLRTAFYDDIKVNVLNYMNLYQSKMEFVETNDLTSILSNGYNSIPVLLVDNKELYFNETNFSFVLEELNDLLMTQSKSTKSHSCKNCGNCKCPADKL